MNSFLEQLNLTPQERRIVVAIGLVVIIVLNLLFVWPHFGEWGRTQKQLAQMYRTIETFNREIAADTNPTNGIKKELAKLERQEGAARMDVQVQLQETIRALALKNGVTVNNYVPVGSRNPQTNEFFEEQSQQITIESQEPQLVAFLYQIGNDPSMIRVSELELSPADQNRYKFRGRITLTANFAKKPPASAAAAKAAKPGAPAAKQPAGPKQPPAAKPPVGPKPGGPPVPGQRPGSNPKTIPSPMAPPGQNPIRKNL
ncbi:MAG: hypothetical protein ABSH38_18310 [Verrucomicrobiota bacterium]|jgi:hypothetical protein